MPCLPDEMPEIPLPPEEGCLSSADIWVVTSPGDDYLQISTFWVSEEAAQAQVAWAKKHFPTSNYSAMTLEDTLYTLTSECCRSRW